MNFGKATGLVLVGLAVSATGFAQDSRIQQIKENIEIFSGILEQSLDLGQSSGLFGLSRGGVETTYLLGQGAVFEVRSPLAARRNRIGLASLSNAVQALGGGNPMADIRRPAGAGEALASAAALRSTGANTYYLEMMDSIANVDYTLAMNTALQQAYDAARSLLNLGDIDDGVYRDIRGEIDRLGDAVEGRFADLRRMRSEMESRAAAGPGDSATDGPALQDRISDLAAEIEPLREQVLAKAQELRLRNERATEAYARNWRREVVEFEGRVYGAVCDYGATLRAVPATENITIILSGLGEDAADNSLPDKIHVFRKSDIDQCQSGGIDVAELQSRANSYSY